MRRLRSAAPAVVASFLLAVAAGCGNDDGSTTTTNAPNTPNTTSAPNKANTRSTPSADTVVQAAEPDVFAEAAGFDNAVGTPERVLVGYSTTDGKLLSGGKVTLELRYGGTKERPAARSPQPDLTAEATYQRIITAEGDTPPSSTTDDAPHLAPPSAGVGLYIARGVTFDRAGFWLVDTKATVGGKTMTFGQAAIEVHDTPQVPAVGQDAPRTENPVIGTPGVLPQEIDSRAGPNGTGDQIPNPELHRVRIIDALDAHRPFVVVVSTPTYCQSRFCGPITDAVAAIAPRFATKADFIHLEVWKDFEKSELSRSAAEWIRPNNGDGREPWVFVVDKNGKIAARFDNVVSEAELVDAIGKVIA